MNMNILMCLSLFSVYSISMLCIYDMDYNVRNAVLFTWSLLRFSSGQWGVSKPSEGIAKVYGFRLFQLSQPLHTSLFYLTPLQVDPSEDLSPSLYIVCVW